MTIIFLFFAASISIFPKPTAKFEIILIVSDKNLRVSRVLNRDQKRSKKEIESIIDKQINEAEAIKYADIVIDNNHKKMLLPSVIREIEKLMVE